MFTRLKLRISFVSVGAAWALLLLFSVYAASAQEKIRVQNVRFEVAGTRVVVGYDLVGPADRDYIVKVILRREANQSFLHIPKTVTGDVGEGRFVGKSKQVTWDILKEFPQGLDGDDFFFVVDVELIRPGSKLLWWIGGGAAVVGGALLLLKDTIFPPKGAAATPEGGFPRPVGRPTGS
jgi:hypothetical protein